MKYFGSYGKLTALIEPGEYRDVSAIVNIMSILSTVLEVNQPHS